MYVDIIASKKFHNAHTQYRAEVAGFVLLRLTCGSRRGRSGGAVKTATAGDDRGTPVYPVLESLVVAMKAAIVKLCGTDADVEVRQDRNGRLYGEITGEGSEEDCIRCLTLLAEEMSLVLGLNRVDSNGRILDRGLVKKDNELRALYDAICHTDGEPAYLYDGVYLEPDGEIVVG